MMIQIKKDSRDSKHITYQWMVDSLQISLAFKSTLDLMNCVWDECICFFDQLHRKSCSWKDVPHHLKADSHQRSTTEPIIHLPRNNIIVISCREILKTIRDYCYSIWEESHTRRVSPFHHGINFLWINCSINQKRSSCIHASILQDHSISTRIITLHVRIKRKDYS